MKKNGLFSVIKWVGFVLLLALLVSCPGSPDIEDGDGPPLEEDFLKGQWAVYYMEGVETPTPYIIDIQHTLPGYWFVMGISDDPVYESPIESDRTETEDGGFAISYGGDIKFIYRFMDDERDTLEVKRSDITGMTYILKRIPREDEIIMHIVSFKLDDSIASAGYTIPSELIAVKDGSSLGEDGLPELKQNDRNVPAKFMAADGTEFTKDTPVTEDITVIVAPAVGD